MKYMKKIFLSFSFILSFGLYAKSPDKTIPQRRVHTRSFTKTASYINTEVMKILVSDFSSLLDFEKWIEEHKNDFLFRYILSQYSECCPLSTALGLNKKFDNGKEFLFNIYYKCYTVKLFNLSKILESKELENSWLKEWFAKIQKINSRLRPWHVVHLEELELEDYELKAIFPFILKCDKEIKISHLYLSDNNLTTLPDDIEKLSELKWFHLEGNKKLKKLPESLVNAKELHWLELEGCGKVLVPIGLKRKCISGEYEFYGEDDLDEEENNYSGPGLVKTQIGPNAFVLNGTLPGGGTVENCVFINSDVPEGCTIS
ncbi:MAG: hypothetical protein ABIA74_04970 [bacterium]